MAATDSAKVPGGWLGFWLGILVTAGLVTALVVAWPDDEARVISSGLPTPTTRYGPGVVPELPELPDGSPATTGPVAQLFVDGLPGAVAEVLAAAGEPTELHELAVYPSYLFVTYRAGDGLVRSRWQGGVVSLDEPGAAGTLDLAELFGADELDLDRIPELVADAPSHYAVPVEVTHVLIDRFLPFDERVLVRVYASPPDDPTGGGYVSYTTDGSLVRVCC